MSFAVLVLRGSAAVFGAVGLAWLLAPAQLGPLVGIELESPTSLADARAVFGGLECGIAGLLWLCARDAARVELGLLAALLAFGGLAFGRLLGFALDGPSDAIGTALLGAELVGLGAAALARGRLRRAR
ncbi:MAG: DUF4345 family protein [Myxococcota bacterium]